MKQRPSEKTAKGGGRPAAKGATSLDAALRRATDYLLGQQSPEGHWVGDLEADATVTAGYIPLTHFLGLRDEERWRKVVNEVRAQQLPDGTWPIYQGGPGDLNATVQCYFGLKLAGVPASDPLMKSAQEFILARGGIERAHTFTKLLLACFGQYPWPRLPGMPPEVMFLPNWFYLNIYEFASWARATIVALLVLFSQRPVCPIPEHAEIGDLYVAGPVPRKSAGLLAWGRFFLVLDRLFKAWERLPFKPGRRAALRKAEQWIIAHQEADGSWGGIMLPWVYSLIALKSLGYTNDHPVMKKGIEGLDLFAVEDGSRFLLQPSESPIWDTALTMIALADAGLPPDHPALAQGARWLIGEQILTGGDWQVKNPKTPPGAWAFELQNDLYPDIDDSAAVLTALLRARAGDEAAQKRAIDRGLRWVLDMQSRDGGWAAFDRDNNKGILAHIPFADFLTPLDPTSPDVTAHLVELLGRSGHRRDRPPLDRALQYLRARQERDGSWFGRWGVNYIYATGAVLAALREVGEDMGQPYIRRAADWLESHQNQDGGWGESCHTYEDPTTAGVGLSTASQTAWALLGLLATGEGHSPAAQRGIDYLLRTQRPDGTWDEDCFTGTGFPRVFYLKYHQYRNYFPLMALARFRALLEEGQS